MGAHHNSLVPGGVVVLLWLLVHHHRRRAAMWNSLRRRDMEVWVVCGRGGLWCAHSVNGGPSKQTQKPKTV